MRRSATGWAMGAVLAVTGTARAEPVSEAVALAAAQRWATAQHVCDAMAGAQDAPRIDRRACARMPQRWAQRGWSIRTVGDDRIATVSDHEESFYGITLTIDPHGRIVRVDARYSRGGI